MRKISLCITTYNRFELTMECFKDVIDDPFVDEIVIVDDCSDIEIYNKLKEACDKIPKVKLYRNEINLDCYRNKREAISKASNEWCILFDSDNIITQDYLTLIYFNQWVENISLMPEWAMPNFDYRYYSGLYIDKYKAAELIDKPMAETMLNCANYFVNKEFYLKCFDENIDPVTSDSLYMNYKWLINGGMIHVVPDLQYEHKVHPQSHYLLNVHRTPTNFREEIMQKIRNFKVEAVI